MSVERASWMLKPCRWGRPSLCSICSIRRTARAAMSRVRPRLRKRGCIVAPRSEELLTQPDIGRVAGGIDVPIDVGVIRRHLEWKRQQAVTELGVDKAGVAPGHGEQQVGLAHHAAGGEVALAAKTHASAQVVAAKFEVLGTQAPPA